MSSINGIGNVGYRPVVAFTSTEPYKSDTQAATTMPQQKEEKKSKHTVLKVLTVAAVVAGAVLLFKNRGKVVEKINALIDKLKPAKPVGKPASPEGLGEIAEVVETTPKPSIVDRIEGMVGLDKPVKSAQESMGVFVKDDVKKALSNKTAITAETIDAGVLAQEAGKSAKESADVFKEFGLTDTEKVLNEAEKKAKPKSPKIPDVINPTKPRSTRKPRGKMPVRTKVKLPQNRALQKIKITDITEPRVINAQTINDMVGINKPVKSAQESMGAFVKDDVKKALSKKTAITAETIDAGVLAQEAGKSAKESAKVFSEYGLTNTEKSYRQLESGVKTPKARANNYEPSKNKVVREHSVLAQGEKVKPRSKTNSRKIRHNKRQIIDQTLAQEQAEFAPMFKGKKKTKIQHPVRQQAQPEQVVNRISTPQVKTTQYSYPESVYKFETETAAKKKAADIKAIWDEYDYRKLYG